MRFNTNVGSHEHPPIYFIFNGIKIINVRLTTININDHV